MQRFRFRSSVFDLDGRDSSIQGFEEHSVMSSKFLQLKSWGMYEGKRSSRKGMHFSNSDKSAGCMYGECIINTTYTKGFLTGSHTILQSPSGAKVQSQSPFHSPRGMFSTSSCSALQLSACSSAYLTRSWLQSWCSLLMWYCDCWKYTNSS